MLGWVKHKLESILPGEMSLTSDMQMTLPLWQKMKIMASGPITWWQIDGETVETFFQTLFFGASKSLQMVTAAMKLKDTCSLEEKFWPT